MDVSICKSVYSQHINGNMQLACYHDRCFFYCHTLGSAIHVSPYRQPHYQKFFKAFISNFRQATAIWLLSLMFTALLLGCFYAISKDIIAVPQILVYFLYAAAALLIVLMNWVFILQCRYVNPIWATTKNALITGIAHPGCTILMVAIFVSPFLLLLLSLKAEPLILCLGFSVPGIIQTKLYGKTLDQIDQMVPGYKTPENNE